MEDECPALAGKIWASISVKADWCVSWRGKRWALHPIRPSWINVLVATPASQTVASRSNLLFTTFCSYSKETPHFLLHSSKPSAFIRFQESCLGDFISPCCFHSIAVVYTVSPAFLTAYVFCFVFVLFVCLFVAFLRAAPMPYGGSQARDLIGAIAAGLHHVCNSTP